MALGYWSHSSNGTTQTTSRCCRARVRISTEPQEWPFTPLSVHTGTCKAATKQEAVRGGNLIFLFRQAWLDSVYSQLTGAMGALGNSELWQESHSAPLCQNSAPRTLQRWARHSAYVYCGRTIELLQHNPILWRLAKRCFISRIHCWSVFNRWKPTGSLSR